MHFWQLLNTCLYLVAQHACPQLWPVLKTCWYVNFASVNFSLVFSIINHFQQASEYPHITSQWDLFPEICVPRGGAVTASVLCCNHFAGTLLEKLEPENLAVFPDNMFVSNMVVRKLVMPDGKESKDFFHGCMQNHSLVPKNVSVFLLLHDTKWLTNCRQHYLTHRMLFSWNLTVVHLKYFLNCTRAQTQYLGMYTIA
jgi:hypothetical protein